MTRPNKVNKSLSNKCASLHEDMYCTVSVAFLYTKGKLAPSLIRLFSDRVFQSARLPLAL